MGIDAEVLARKKLRAARLAELRDHPSWAELQVVLNERRDRVFESMRRQLMAGEPADQRYIDRVAGFFVGAQWILDNPDMAENALERAVHKAALLGISEGEEV